MRAMKRFLSITMAFMLLLSAVNIGPLSPLTLRGAEEDDVLVSENPGAVIGGDSNSYGTDLTDYIMEAEVQLTWANDSSAYPGILLNLREGGSMAYNVRLSRLGVVNLGCEEDEDRIPAWPEWQIPDFTVGEGTGTVVHIKAVVQEDKIDVYIKKSTDPSYPETPQISAIDEKTPPLAGGSVGYYVDRASGYINSLVVKALSTPGGEPGTEPAPTETRTVNFNTGDGTPEMAPLTLTATQITILSTNKYAAPRYYTPGGDGTQKVIEGWYTDPSFTEASRWSLGFDIVTDDMDGMTLYAKWIDKTTPFETYGVLQIIGTYICDERGNPVQLRGMSTYGLHEPVGSWVVTDEAFNALAKDWKSDLVRVAMHVGEQASYGYAPAQMLALVEQAIAYATQYDMYVMVDWHTHRPGDPFDPVYMQAGVKPEHIFTMPERFQQLYNDAKANGEDWNGPQAFFAYIADKYGQQGNILYETTNEPNGNYSDNSGENTYESGDPRRGYSDWIAGWRGNGGIPGLKAYHEKVLPVIRTFDTRGLYLAGTPGYSGNPHAGGDLADNLADPLNTSGTGYPQIAYSRHFYSGDNPGFTGVASAEALGRAVFITEWGTTDGSGGGANAFARTDQIFRNELDSRMIGWANWSMSTRNEESSAFVPSTTRVPSETTSDPGVYAWDFWNDLSNSGRYIRSVLRGENAPNYDVGEIVSDFEQGSLDFQVSDNLTANYAAVQEVVVAPDFTTAGQKEGRAVKIDNLPANNMANNKLMLKDIPHHFGFSSFAYSIYKDVRADVYLEKAHIAGGTLSTDTVISIQPVIQERVSTKTLTAVNVPLSDFTDLGNGLLWARVRIPMAELGNYIGTNGNPSNPSQPWEYSWLTNPQRIQWDIVDLTLQMALSNKSGGSAVYLDNVGFFTYGNGDAYPTPADLNIGTFVKVPFDFESGQRERWRLSEGIVDRRSVAIGMAETQALRFYVPGYDPATSDFYSGGAALRTEGSFPAPYSAQSGSTRYLDDKAAYVMDIYLEGEATKGNLAILVGLTWWSFISDAKKPILDPVNGGELITTKDGRTLRKYQIDIPMSDFPLDWGFRHLEFIVINAMGQYTDYKGYIYYDNIALLTAKEYEDWKAGTPTVPSVTYTAEADGAADTEASTKITLTFSKALETDLTAAEIMFNGGSTGAGKGALTKISGTVYELALSGTIQAAGNSTLSITKAGVEARTKTVTLHAGQPAEVDKTALNALIGEADALVETVYTAASWIPFANALSAAKTVAAKGNATQTEVNNALSALQTAKNNLVTAAPPDSDILFQTHPGTLGNGASGFIGAGLTDYILEARYRITNNGSGNYPNMGLQTRYTPGNDVCYNIALWAPNASRDLDMVQIGIYEDESRGLEGKTDSTFGKKGSVNTWYNIRAVVSGNHMEVFIKEDGAAEWPDDPVVYMTETAVPALSGGSVGWSAYNCASEISEITIRSIPTGTVSPVLSNKPETIGDGKIKVNTVAGAEDGASLYYMIAPDKGIAPADGTSISAVPGVAPLTLGSDIGTNIQEGQYLRVYATDNQGQITGFGSVRVAMENIGVVIALQAGPVATASQDRLGSDALTDYVVETKANILSVPEGSSQYANATLAMRSQDNGDAYCVWIGKNGAVSIGRENADDAFEGITEVTLPNFKQGESGTTVYIKAVVQGAKIKVYLKTLERDPWPEYPQLTATDTSGDPLTGHGVAWGFYQVNGVFGDIKIMNIRTAPEDKGTPPGKTQITNAKAYTVFPPVAGIYPQSFYKYRFTETSVPGLFTQTTNNYEQTLEYDPPISKVFENNTQYKAILTLTPVNNTRTFNNVTLDQVANLPTEGVVSTSVQYYMDQMIITIVFEKTGVWDGKVGVVFEDDFTGSGVDDLDPAKWELGPKWDRQGRSNWSDDMVDLKDGNLVLSYQKDPALGAAKTSNQSDADNWIRAGAVRSRSRGASGTDQGKPLFEHTYGYYESRIKFPASPGVWGAFWLFGRTQYVNNDHGIVGMEIDIVESIMNDQKRMNAALHWQDNLAEADIQWQVFPKDLGGINVYDGEYHLFAVDWSPTEYIFYVDDMEYARYSTNSLGTPNICQNPNYIKFSIEGSGFAGPVTNDSGEMLVDWVKVYDRPKNMTETPSSGENNVTGVTSPAGGTVNGTTITATVANSVTSQLIGVTVSDGASWALYADEACGTEIKDKTMRNLVVGENRAYIQVTAENGDIHVYTLVITRKPAGLPLPPLDPDPPVSPNPPASSNGGGNGKPDETEQPKDNTIVITAPVSKDGNSAQASLPVTGNADIRVEAKGIGEVTISQAVLAEITEVYGEKISVTIRKNEDSSLTFLFAADNAPIHNIAGGIKVHVPDMAGQASGNVVVFVLPDGTEKIIKKSLVDEAGAYALLKGSGTIKVIDKAKRFEDVSEGFWGSKVISFISSHGLMVGVSETKFAPNDPMTRAMLVTVLHKLEDEIQSGANQNFADVKDGAWYAQAIGWAKENGIAQGYGAGVFGVNDQITREQMAAILYGYAKYIGIDTTPRGQADSYKDSDKLSDWANDAMNWAIGAGLIQSDNTGALNPKGEVTRVQAAEILRQLVMVVLKQ